MNIKTFIIGALLAAALQTGALAKMIFDRATFLQNGTEVILQTGMIDPRDIFRGHYVRLDLAIGRLDPKDVQAPPHFIYDDVLYIELQQGDGLFATAKSVTREYPANPTGPVIKGTARSNFSNNSGATRPFQITYPFDRFFAPKLRAQELEDLRRDRKLGLILVLDDMGNGAIKGITIDGEKIYEEPLY